jgi:hypothetical protein
MIVSEQSCLPALTGQATVKTAILTDKEAGSSIKSILLQQEKASAPCRQA